jgi:hypothetical protein
MEQSMLAVRRGEREARGSGEKHPEVLEDLADDRGVHDRC